MLLFKLRLIDGGEETPSEAAHGLDAPPRDLVDTVLAESEQARRGLGRGPRVQNRAPLIELLHSFARPATCA